MPNTRQLQLRRRILKLLLACFLTAFFKGQHNRNVRKRKSVTQSNLTSGRIAATDGRFNRIRQVAPMCPHERAHWRHLANTIELVLPSAHPTEFTTQTANRSVQSFLHSSRQKVPILYNGCLFPQKFPLPIGDLDLHRLYDSLGQSEPINSITIGSAVFAQMTQSVPILCNGPPLPPQNCCFAWGC